MNIGKMNANRKTTFGVKPEVLVFKTDIDTENKVRRVRLVLDRQASIADWSVDIEDIDNVLRIVIGTTMAESAIVDLLKINSFHCEVLTD